MNNQNTKTVKPKKLVCGVGITDIPVTEKECIKPSYVAWANMLKRAYYTKYQTKKPTYKGCSVHQSWHLYSVFDQWFQTNYKPGYHLDKDLLVYGNRIYGPNTCRYVPQAINSLFLDHAADRGQYPIGVNYNKTAKKVQARCNDGTGKLIHLGLFNSETEAHQAWRNYKKSVIKKVADEALQLGQIQQDLYDAIMNRPI